MHDSSEKRYRPNAIERFEEAIASGINGLAEAIQTIEFISRWGPILFRQPDDSGALPLHRAIRNGAPDKLIERVCQAYPEATRKPDRSGILPLHEAILSHSGLSVVQMLLVEFPEAIRVPLKENKLLPLQLACAEYKLMPPFHPNKRNCEDVVVFLLYQQRPWAGIPHEPTVGHTAWIESKLFLHSRGGEKFIRHPFNYEDISAFLLDEFPWAKLPEGSIPNHAIWIDATKAEALMDGRYGEKIFYLPDALGWTPLQILVKDFGECLEDKILEQAEILKSSTSRHTCVSVLFREVWDGKHFGAPLPRASRNGLGGKKAPDSDSSDNALSLGELERRGGKVSDGRSLGGRLSRDSSPNEDLSLSLSARRPYSRQLVDEKECNCIDKKEDPLYFYPHQCAYYPKTIVDDQNSFASSVVLVNDEESSGISIRSSISIQSDHVDSFEDLSESSDSFQGFSESSDSFEGFSESLQMDEEECNHIDKQDDPLYFYPHQCAHHPKIIAGDQNCFDSSLDKPGKHSSVDDEESSGISIQSGVSIQSDNTDVRRRGLHQTPVDSSMHNRSSSKRTEDSIEITAEESGNFILSADKAYYPEDSFGIVAEELGIFNQSAPSRGILREPPPKRGILCRASLSDIPKNSMDTFIHSISENPVPPSRGILCRASLNNSNHTSGGNPAVPSDKVYYPQQLAYYQEKENGDEESFVSCSSEEYASSQEFYNSDNDNSEFSDCGVAKDGTSFAKLKNRTKSNEDGRKNSCWSRLVQKLLQCIKRKKPGTSRRIPTDESSLTSLMTLSEEESSENVVIDVSQSEQIHVPRLVPLKSDTEDESDESSDEESENDIIDVWSSFVVKLLERILREWSEFPALNMGHGRRPLHLVCSSAPPPGSRTRTSIDAIDFLVRHLVGACPEELATRDATPDRNTPLHGLVASPTGVCTVDLLRFCMAKHREALSIRNASGFHPFQVAAAADADLDIIYFLLRLDPLAVGTIAG